MTQGAATGRLQNLSLAGPAGLLLALVPVAAALRLTANGGGYTIDEWGIWGAVTVVAAGVALVSQPVTRLSGVQRVLPPRQGEPRAVWGHGRRSRTRE